MKNKIVWRIPALKFWLWNEDDEMFLWREPDGGNRLFQIRKNGPHWEVFVIHTDRSIASINKYFPRSRDALAALRRDSDFG